MAKYSYSESEFGQKYDQYCKLVYRTAYQYLLSAAEAEDVTQEVFVKLLLSKKAFTSGEHEKAWLLRVTINLCKNTLKSKAFQSAQLQDDVKESTAFEDEVNQKIDMEKELGRLSGEQRAAIYLFYYEGYSLSDTAKLMRAKENTVKSYLRRARQTLKINLEKGEEK